MKNILTITCHEVYNHGASLQEYALLEFLNSNGYSAQTIHYKPPYLDQNGNTKAISKRMNYPLLRNIYFWLKRKRIHQKIARIKTFDDFAIQYIPTHSKRYTTNEELKADLPQADAYICGSDQIWNSYFPNGKDPAFYLNFVPDTAFKMSYAASFALDTIAPQLENFVYEQVSRLDVIGVRETSGVAILNKLGIDRAVQVLDPVFLLDKAHWETTFKLKATLAETPYVFIYDFDSNEVIKEIALHLKKTKGYKIFTVNQNIDYADENYFTSGPITFLNLVKNAAFTLTNSFHAVAFSLIFEKQFRVINRAEKINTRMRDLLQLVNCSDILIASFADFEKAGSIDYTKVTPMIQQHRLRSQAFLLDSLRMIK